MDNGLEAHHEASRELLVTRVVLPSSLTLDAINRRAILSSLLQTGKVYVEELSRAFGWKSSRQTC